MLVDMSGIVENGSVIVLTIFKLKLLKYKKILVRNVIFNLSK